MELALEKPDAIGTGARSRLYSRLAQGFRYPTTALYEMVHGGGFLSEVKGALRELPFPLPWEGSLGSGFSWEQAQLENQHVWLFDVGGPNPNTGEWEVPCFLYEAEYGGGRLKVMEDTLRFYHHFGLRLSKEKGKRDRPDHLPTELEFLHALSFKEAELLQKENAVEVVASYQRAQRDFLRFHVADFLPSVAAKVVPRRISFYSDLVRLADEFCRADLAYLRSTLAE